MATPPTRVDVLGVGISCIDLPSTVDIFADWIAEEHRQYVCVTGMHGVMESQTDATLRDIHNASGLTTPDGMPMVWAGRRAGAEISRVYGPDLMDAVLCRAVEEGWSSYFLGGSESVLTELVATLGARYPGLAVAGSESPPFRPLSEEEDAAMVERVNAAAPDIVWVGLGTPKQERFMASHRSERPSTSWPARFPRRRPGCGATAWSGCTASEPSRDASGAVTSSMAPGSPSAWCAAPRG